MISKLNTKLQCYTTHWLPSASSWQWGKESQPMSWVISLECEWWKHASTLGARWGLFCVQSMLRTRGESSLSLSSTTSHWSTRQSSMQAGASLQETSDPALCRSQASISRTFHSPSIIGTKPLKEKKKSKKSMPRGKERWIAIKISTLVPQYEKKKVTCVQQYYSSFSPLTSHKPLCSQVLRENPFFKIKTEPGSRQVRLVVMLCT